MRRYFENNSDDLKALEPIDPEEVQRTLCEERVQELFDWYSGLDSRLDEVASSVRSAVEDFVQKTDANTELLGIATGITSDWDDDYAIPLPDFYERWETNVSSLIKTLLNSDRTRDVREILNKVVLKRNTHTHAQVVSLHSFDTHKDYYLVLSEAVTQPQAIYKSGNNTIIGFTKSLYTNIWPNISGTDHLEKYWPSTVVNKTTNYSSTDGWEVTNSVSCGALGSASGQGVSGSVNVSYTYSEKVSHSSQKTWTTQDYEIIPVPRNFDSGGKTFRDAGWWNSITWPDTKGSPLSVAAGTTINLATEAIFSVPSEQSESFRLIERTDVGEGALFIGHGSSAVVYGQLFHLNIIRPLHLAFTALAYNGPKNKRQYLAKFNADGDWTAEADVDWIEMLDEDGNPGQTTSGKGGTVFLYFEVSENNTGHQRRGNVTIKSGKDSIFFPFTQGS